MKQRRRVSLQPAFLLHRRAFRDASVIAEFITRDHGRVALVVRGSGKGSRRCLEVFTPLLVSYSLRNDLGALTAVEASDSAWQLAPEEVFCGYYANELLMRMTHPGEPVAELFTAYAELLGVLRTGDACLRGLRLFEKRLLESLGYAADLTREWRSQSPLDPHGMYRLLPEQGPELAAEGVRGKDVFAGSSLLSLAREDLSDDLALRDARRLLRLALDFYLGGRPLKSREVMRSMQRQRGVKAVASVGKSEA